VSLWFNPALNIRALIRVIRGKTPPRFFPRISPIQRMWAWNSQPIRVHQCPSVVTKLWGLGRGINPLLQFKSPCSDGPGYLRADSRSSQFNDSRTLLASTFQAPSSGLHRLAFQGLDYPYVW